MINSQFAVVAGFLLIAGGLFWAVGGPSLIVDAGVLLIAYACVADD